MRALLLIMTGIGFTLGLLCGLLLQLPADGLPANDITDDSNRLSLSVVRSRRRFPDVHSPSQQNVLASDKEKTAVDRATFGGDSYRAGREAGGHGETLSPPHPPRPEPGAAPDVRGSRSQPVGGRSGNSGPAATDSGHQSLPPRPGLPGDGGGGGERGRKAPVTTFTLRLKKSGEKIVVNSAQQSSRVVSDSDVSSASSDTAPGTQSLPMERLVNGVVWSTDVEDACPSGFHAREVASWRRKARDTQIVRVEEGCGRMQNRLVTFRDASKACARYRLNADQMQGEVYSHYLARLLNITNLPPAILLPVNTLSDQWRAVHLDVTMAQWADGRLVVLTQWLEGLTPAHIPQELRSDTRRLHPTRQVLAGKTGPELCELLQWSDLIVFDYLTANLDRLVNNMFNKQWNADMMNNPAHNLEKRQDGTLVFLDNESGLFHGYRLLDKYHDYHEALLASLCVFRERTARAVKALHRAGGVGQELHKLMAESEQHHRLLPPIPDNNARVLKVRLARVYDQIVKCEQLYGAR